METEAYEAVVHSITVPIGAWPHYVLIAERHGLSQSTVQSIHMQVATLATREGMPALRRSMQEACSRYLAGCDIMQLCISLGSQPCTAVRELLKALPLGLQANPKAVTQVLRRPEALPAVCNGAHDPALLQQLQADVQTCVSCDCTSGPVPDKARHDIGQQYEHKLNECLQDQGIAFWTEAQLRESGHVKTPDARLQVPIAVRGRVVHWIDSKATFGSHHVHQEQLLDQYEKYLNRYGPGLVIYWFGMMAGLDTSDGNLLLLDQFPAAQDVVQLPRLMLPQEAQAQPTTFLPAGGHLPASTAACSVAQHA